MTRKPHQIWNDMERLLEDLPKYRLEYLAFIIDCMRDGLTLEEAKEAYE